MYLYSQAVTADGWNPEPRSFSIPFHPKIVGRQSSASSVGRVAPKCRHQKVFATSQQRQSDLRTMLCHGSRIRHVLQNGCPRVWAKISIANHQPCDDLKLTPGQFPHSGGRLDGLRIRGGASSSVVSLRSTEPQAV